MEDTHLYLIVVIHPSKQDLQDADWLTLEEGLYVAETSHTRSQIYHEAKRRFVPEKLLVASLSDLPKFKGMRRGVMAALKQRHRFVE